MQGLLLLLQRVRLEAARAAAAPAERLLDDVLRLLDPTRPVDDEQAYQVQPTAGHLYYSFRFRFRDCNNPSESRIPVKRLLDDVLRLLDPMRPVDDDQAYEVQPTAGHLCCAGTLPETSPHSFRRSLYRDMSA